MQVHIRSNYFTRTTRQSVITTGLLYCIKVHLFALIMATPHKLGKENILSARLRSPPQDLTRLLLDCPASEPIRRAIFDTTSSIFDLWSWSVILRTPVLRKGSGSTTSNVKFKEKIAEPLIISDIHTYFDILDFSQTTEN